MTTSFEAISMWICFAVLIKPIVISVTIHHDQSMVLVVVVHVFEQAFDHRFHHC